MLILASQSPRRSDLLTQIDADFEVIVSNYEENHNFSSDPEELAKLHACGKAEEVYTRTKDRKADVILGVDTLVYLNSEILGKPKDRQDAKKMITKLSGHTHQVMSAMCFIRIVDGYRQIHIETTHVTFYELTEDEVEKYLDTGEWDDKAGGYAIQGAAKEFVKNIDGDFSNVVGLPLHSFSKIYNELIK